MPSSTMKDSVGRAAVPALAPLGLMRDAFFFEQLL